MGREDIKITLCVPFPDGKPLCALCGEPRITHATVFEMKMPDGMAGRGFGALCDDCAAPYVADVQGNPEAN